MLKALRFLLCIDWTTLLKGVFCLLLFKNVFLCCCLLFRLCVCVCDPLLTDIKQKKSLIGSFNEYHCHKNLCPVARTPWYLLAPEHISVQPLAREEPYQVWKACVCTSTASMLAASASPPHTHTHTLPTPPSN